MMDPETYPEVSNLNAWTSRRHMLLLTDLYELTMVSGFIQSGMAERRVCFEYFFREFPPDTGFAVFAGLEDLLAFIEHAKFSDSDIEYLTSLKIFPREVLSYFKSWTCHCDVWAVPEGTLVFPNEPLIRVEGPLAEAQLLESFLLNALNYPTLIASKAARMCLAAAGDPVLEFGLRRAQGPDGALTGTRAAYIGGCSGTSNCLAGKVFGIPVKGTHAHSWVMAFPSELEAFRTYARLYPDNCILLVDTYDTLGSGVPNAIKVFTELRKTRPDIQPAIRIDSGDLAELSKAAYRMFFEAGFTHPTIIASNDLDEYLIADIKRQGAEINAWGVGTHLITAWDQPALGGVYKLTAIHDGTKWIPKIKLSANINKLTNPGRKTIHRIWNRYNHPVGDLLASVDASPLEKDHIVLHDPVLLQKKIHIRNPDRIEPLLIPVVQNGQRIAPPEPLPEIRSRALRQIESLPAAMKRLRNPDRYPVGLCSGLADEKGRIIQSITIHR